MTKYLVTSFNKPPFVKVSLCRVIKMRVTSNIMQLANVTLDHCYFDIDKEGGKIKVTDVNTPMDRTMQVGLNFVFESYSEAAHHIVKKIFS